MNAPYRRPPGAAQADYAASKAWEAEVASHLPAMMIDRTASTTEMDWYVPGFFLDAKERKQPLSNRWPLPPGVDRENAFVLDELSLRKALKHGYMSYFVFRDVPNSRVFLAAAWEVSCANKVRVNRGGKGKLILDLTEFRLVGSLDELSILIHQDQVDCRWKLSECISEKTIQQV